MPAKGHLGPGTYMQACVVCDDEFKVRASDVAKAKERGCSPPIYCSLTCRNTAYRGEGNPKWSGGVVRQESGYLYEYAPDHPHATQDGYVMQHRLVVERVLGRVLDPVEQVHHRNHVRDDNRPENLEVQADVRAHRALHAYYETHACPTCGVEVVSSVAHRRRFARKFCSRKCAAAAGSASAIATGRHKLGTGAARPRRGEQVHNAKITEDIVRQIRAMVSEGQSQRSVGERFGISQGSVSLIARGKNWGHVK